MSQSLPQKPESRKTRTAQQPEHEDMLTKKGGLPAKNCDGYSALNYELQ